MKRKILAMDIDGTLTDSDKNISPATKAALTHMMELGHGVVLASGRPLTGIRRYQRELELERFGGYVLAFNGGCMVECRTGEILDKKVLEQGLLPDLYAFAKERGCGLATHVGDVSVSAFEPDRYVDLEARINGMTVVKPENFVEYVDFEMYKCLMTADPSRAAEVEKELRERCGDRADVYRSDPYFIEVMPRNVDKGTAMGRLLELIGGDWADTICCGDGYNDISMIKRAGLGVAMRNAQPQVRESADYVAPSNDEDGIVHVIERFILEQGGQS